MMENRQGLCTDWEQKLAALQPATLIDDEALKHHIQHCSQCALTWEHYQLMRTFVSSLLETEPLPAFPPRLYEIWEQEERAQAGVCPVLPQKHLSGER